MIKHVSIFRVGVDTRYQILDIFSKLRSDRMGDRNDVFIAFVLLIVFNLDVVPFNLLPDPSTVDEIPSDVRCDDLPHDMLFKPPLAPYPHHPPFPSLKTGCSARHP